MKNCSSDESVYNWGLNSDGNKVEMTYKDFFDTYITDYNFTASELEIKQEKIKYFPELSKAQATHYVKYTS